MKDKQQIIDTRLENYFSFDNGYRHIKYEKDVIILSHYRKDAIKVTYILNTDRILNYDELVHRNFKDYVTMDTKIDILDENLKPNEMDCYYYYKMLCLMKDDISTSNKIFQYTVEETHTHLVFSFSSYGNQERKRHITFTPLKLYKNLSEVYSLTNDLNMIKYLVDTKENAKQRIEDMKNQIVALEKNVDDCNTALRTILIDSEKKEILYEEGENTFTVVSFGCDKDIRVSKNNKIVDK